MCARPSDRGGRHICSACLMRVPFVNPTGGCRVCGRNAERLTSDYLCDDCVEIKPKFDRAASAFRFEGTARDLLLKFKFRSGFYLRDDLVDWLEASTIARFDVNAVDVVIPVPITWSHRWLRGYAPCDILAQSLARRLDRRYLGRALKRVGRPRRQSGLDELSRRENARGSVAVRLPELVRGRTVLVVDDVMTTGATLSACAEALKVCGADRVWCTTLARSIRS